MPTIKDVTPFVIDAVKTLENMRGIKSVYTFGSFAENHRSPKYNIKDIDILVLCDFDSGDFLSIDNGPCSALTMTKEDLEDDGFNPQCINFTKKCMVMKNYGFDIWAISKDKTLLHWGSMPESVEEWKEIRHASEKKAFHETKLKRSHLCTANEEQRRSWKNIYENEMMRLANDNPLGWYASITESEEILKRSIPIESIS